MQKDLNFKINSGLHTTTAKVLLGGRQNSKGVPWVGVLVHKITE